MNACNPSILSAYHDGELSAAATAEVESHLLSCPECQQTVASYRKLSATFDRAPLPTLSPAAAARILRDAAAAERYRILTSIARPFAAAAVLILSLGIPLLAVSPDVSASSTASPVPTSWESTLLTRDTDPTRTNPQVQLADFIASDLATARR